MTQETHKGPESEKRNLRLLLFVLIALGIFFTISYTGRLIEHTQAQAQVTVWEQRIDDAYARQAELVAQRDFVNSDAYVDWVARERLGLAREQDKVVIVLADRAERGVVTEVHAPEDGATHTSLAQSDVLPIWRQWLALFTREPAAAPER